MDSSSSAISIKVRNVKDKNLEFVQMQSVTRIAEDVPTFTKVRNNNWLDFLKEIGHSKNLSI